MKKITLTVLILTIVFAAPVRAGESISVTAKGLVCDFCAKALEKVFLRQSEVSAIRVNLTTKEILINLKEGQAMDDAVIQKLVTDAGYSIAKIVRNKEEWSHEIN